MSTSNAWRLFGALGILQLLIVFGGFAFGAPMIELRSTPGQVHHALVETAQWRGLAAVYTELLYALIVMVAGMLLARLLRRPDVLGGWLAGVVGAAAVLDAALGGISAVAGGVTHYDAHHGADLGLLTSIDHLRDFAFFGSVAALGLMALAAGAAIVRTRVLVPLLGWAGVVVGIFSIGSLAGAVGGLHNIANLLTMVWVLILSLASFRVRAGEQG